MRIRAIRVVKLLQHLWKQLAIVRRAQRYHHFRQIPAAQSAVGQVEEFPTRLLYFFSLLLDAFSVSRSAQLVHHQGDARHRREKHFSFSEVALEKFVLNVRVHRQSGLRSEEHTSEL